MLQLQHRNPGTNRWNATRVVNEPGRDRALGTIVCVIQENDRRAGDHPGWPKTVRGYSQFQKGPKFNTAKYDRPASLTLITCQVLEAIARAKRSCFVLYCEGRKGSGGVGGELLTALNLHHVHNKATRHKRDLNRPLYGYTWYSKWQIYCSSVTPSLPVDFIRLKYSMYERKSYAQKLNTT